jgi:hypothetical protein
MCCAPQSPCADTIAVSGNPAAPRFAGVDIASYGTTCDDNFGQSAITGTLTLQTTPDGIVQGSYDVGFGTRRLTGTFRLPVQCSQPGCGT